MTSHISSLPHALVLDLETQREFAEVGGRNRAGALGVSLVGVFDYATKELKSFDERELDKVTSLLASRAPIIGFNIKRFDFEVLQPHVLEFNLQDLKVVDILLDIEHTIGFRLSLDAVASATLGKIKTGHGLEAIRLYRAGYMAELAKYCLDDVALTRDIYEFGKKNNHILYRSHKTLHLERIPVQWK